MLPLVIYDPAVNPDPFANGFLTYGQLPLFPLFVQDFPLAKLATFPMCSRLRPWLKPRAALE